MKVSMSWIRWFGAVAAAVALLYAAGWTGPRLPFYPMAAFALGFSAVAGESLLVSLLVPRALPRMLPWLAVPVAALLLVHLTGGASLAAAAAVTASLLVGGTLLGSVVGSAIEHPGHLGFVAVASAVADLFSMYSPAGVTAAVVESPAVLSLVSLPWPMLGTGQVESFLGVGEVIFCSLYLAASRVHALGVKRTAVALAGAFVLTLLALVLFERAIPALPFLGAAVVLAHPQARRPAAADRRRGWIAMAVLLLVFLAWLLVPRS
jgi:hypothetical protein